MKGEPLRLRTLRLLAAHVSPALGVGSSMLVLLSVLSGLLPVYGCTASHSVRHDSLSATPARVSFDLYDLQSIDGLGAGQGVEVRDGFVYLYGDGETGVIREFEAVGLDSSRPRLQPTNRVISLTHNGRDALAHPTGLTHHPAFGTIMGDTVGGIGRIHFLDWGRALSDGNLDHALLHSLHDDLAVNGTRPEFVEYLGKPYVATSDYGSRGNAVRLYRPESLRDAEKTSDDGVLAYMWKCGPWVQNLHWSSHTGLLFLVQNQIEGKRWQLTTLNLRLRNPAVRQVIRFDGHDDELEGFHMLGRGHAIFYTSSRQFNTCLADVVRE